jgi:hypothetical protein
MQAAQMAWRVRHFFGESMAPFVDIVAVPAIAIQDEGLVRSCSRFGSRCH